LGAVTRCTGRVRDHDSGRDQAPPAEVQSEYFNSSTADEKFEEFG
jgi:hypothetical protein